jgi:TPR repeat protein
VRAAVESPKETVSLILGELALSKSPSRSALLISILRTFAAYDILLDLPEQLAGIPGKNDFAKLMFCERVLQLGFASTAFDHNLEDYLNRTLEANFPKSQMASSTTLSIQSLAPQHEEAWVKWLHHRGFHRPYAEDCASVLAQLQAESSSSEAKYLLALAYAEGFLVERDISRCLALMKEAATAGCLDAQCTLGLLYHLGWQGLQKDPEKAEFWLRAAAEDGSSAALEILEKMGHGGRISTFNK